MSNTEPSEWSYRIRQSDNRTAVLINLIRFGFMAVLAVCGYGSIAVLAGKATFANVGVAILGDFRVSEGVAWLFGALGTGIGWRERRLRKQVNQELGGRVSYLESLLDPSRSSSELTEAGQTNPDDE